MAQILEDIRILDFTHVWFGPYCTMMLAELGAEVIKVEPPWGTIGRLGPGALFKQVSTTFYALNLNKKDISVDLKSEEGKSIIKELIKQSDVVVQNFVPGTLERLGFSYEVQKELNSKIIYAALSGFGQSGPYSRYASYAVIAEAMSGHTFSNARRIRGDGPPSSLAGAIGDIGPATFAAFAITAAIRHRDRTGEGQMVDINQTDTMVSFNTCSSVGHALWVDSGQTPPERRRSDDPTRIGGMYKVSDGWVQLMGARAKALESLKEALGVEELTNDMLKGHIEKMTRREAFKFLGEMGFPSAPVYEAHEAMDDPHLLDRGMWVKASQPAVGEYRVPNFPAKFYKTPGEVVSGAPMLGQHTEEVLTTMLGYTPEQVKALEKEGKVVCWRE
jgi:crotonobetainyl-CoA:carnitine CoA-transferase CaiB-like acyl-CoA transferase